MSESDQPRAFVLAPAPLLTITVEAGDEGDEIHLHAGGQGFWQARMLAELGTSVVLCAALGGETGDVLAALAADMDVSLRVVEVTTSNGAYVHDRRSGERREVAEMVPPGLSRHDVDELYGAALIEGLDADVCVLGGPHYDHLVPNDIYRRLAHDLTANGKLVVVDLSGGPLDAALEGGVSVVKVSHEELESDERVAGTDRDELVEAMHALRKQGAEHVVVTRAEEPALALFGDSLYEVEAPELQVEDHRGAGDSLTAGIAAGLARGLDPPDALKLGAAAGALNVTRRGLASGRREEIERLTERVELRTLDGAGTGSGS
jgi:1-phosphofructokinase